MMTFDEWFDTQTNELHNYACYEEYQGSIYTLMEKAYQAGVDAALDEVFP